MTGHPYQAKARRLAPALYEVAFLAFPGTFVLIHAPDEAEALRRAVPPLVGCIIDRYRDR